LNKYAGFTGPEAADDNAPLVKETKGLGAILEKRGDSESRCSPERSTSRYLDLLTI